MDLSKKRIMLTGGAGFLGSFVTEKLKAMPVPHKRYAHQAAKARGCKHIFIPKEQDYDLTKSDRIVAAFKDAAHLFSSSPDSRLPTPDSRLPTPDSRPPRPLVDIVIHLAAKVGGIGANRANPGSFFYDEAMLVPHKRYAH